MTTNNTYSMNIYNDIEKTIDSLNYLIDIFDKADIDKEDDLNGCLNNFILFATQNEYLANLKANNASEDNLLGIVTNTIAITYENLEEMKGEGMGLEDKDKMCALLEMSSIIAKCYLTLYLRIKQGEWPVSTN